MRCHSVQNEFTAYLEGGLDRSQREAIERHLRGCMACRADLEALRQTVRALHDTVLLPPVGPPPRIQAKLAKKIQAVRQPMSWTETLRLQWRVAGLAAQARAWGVGLAVTASVAIGAVTLDRWHVSNGEPLNVVPSVGVGAPGAPGAVPAPGEMRPGAQAVRIHAFPESPMIAGQMAKVYFAVDALQDLPDVAVYLTVDGGMTVLGGLPRQGDASYLLWSGPVGRSAGQGQWLPKADLFPSHDGDYALRVTVREGDRVAAEETIRLPVGPAAR